MNKKLKATKKGCLSHFNLTERGKVPLPMIRKITAPFSILSVTQFNRRPIKLL